VLVPVSRLTGTAPAVRYDIRRTDPSDAKPEVLRLWSRNFQGLPEARYGWIYESNPSGRAICWLAIEADNGTVVGSTALFPRRLVIRGEPRIAGVAGDFAVDSRHRGFGPALALQHAAVSACAAAGFSFLYGVSTSKSAPVQQRAGYRMIGNCYRLTRVLRTASYLRKMGAAGATGLLARIGDAILSGGAKERWCRTPPGLALEVLSTFDTRFDQLWQRSSAGRPLSADRSSEHLNWRFARCPVRTYTTYALVRENDRDVLGYLVTHRAAETIHISDFFVGNSDGNYEKMADVLLTQFLRLQRQKGASSVSASYFGSGAFVKKLQGFGFSLRDRESVVLAYVPPGSSDASWICDPENWCLFEADADT